MSKRFGETSRNKIFALLCIFILLLFASCGGGGGGGGAVSLQNGSQLHNGGGNSGWGSSPDPAPGFGGSSGSDITSGELLISQMAALDNIASIRIELVINGKAQQAIVADAATTTDALPKIKVGDTVSGRAYIYVAGEANPRVAELDQTEIVLHNTLKFKVPYKYECYDLNYAFITSGTYYARDGIHLEAETQDPIAGWYCVQDGTTHYGGYVSGFRGDIRLNAITADGAPVLSAVSDKTELYATSVAPSNDTATLTISGGSGAYSVAPDASSAGVIECTGSGSSWIVSIKNDTSTPNATGKVMFADNMNATINVTDTMSGATTSACITLKNKYSIQFGLSYDDGMGNFQNENYIPSATYYAGETFDFSTVDQTSTGLNVPANRQIVAYKDGFTNTIYKLTTTPPDTLTFSYALGRRDVYLGACLNFRFSNDFTYGGYVPPGTTIPATGIETNPYLVNYYGTDVNKQNQLYINIFDYTCDANALIMECNKTGLFDITQQANGYSFVVKLNQLLSVSDSRLNGNAKLTVTDPATGATKDIYVAVRKDPVFTVSFNTGSNGSTAPATQSVPTGECATRPATNPTNSVSTATFVDWYAGTVSGGVVTLDSTPYDFSVSPTSDLTLYAKWRYTHFSGNAEDFYVADFVQGNDASSPYTVTITSATNEDLANIGKALGKSTDSNYKGGVYVNLNLSNCGATEIPNSAFNSSTASWGSPELATYLIGITLPNTLSKINHYAFYGCTALSGTLTIPASVEYFGYQCFYKTTSPYYIFSDLSYQDTTSIWKKYDWDNNLMSSVSPTTCPTLSLINAGSSGATSWRKQ